MMKQYLAKIEKECVMAMPLARPSGKIVVVKSAREADFAVSKLMGEPIVGFDTETRPNFVSHVQHTVSLMQVATATECYLFRLQFIGEHQGLKALIESTDVLKVGLSVKDDFHSLQKWMPVQPQNFIELQNFVTSFGIEDKSLQKIYAIVFGKRISKTQQLSNWEQPILTPQQKVYAAIDAWACREIYLELNNQQP